jgi:cell wall assembly regulator SMI1
VTDLALLLTELEQRWTEKGSDDRELMAPGLDRAEVVRTLEGRALPAPGEVVEWFAWRNGVRSELARPRWVLLAPSSFQQLSLPESLEERETRIQGAAQAAADAGPVDDAEDRELLDPTFWWEPTWLPIARAASPMLLTVDLAGTSDSAPVLVVEWSDIDGFRRTRAGSLAEFVRVLLNVPDACWRWLPAERRWDFSAAELPMEFRLTSFF